MGLAAEPSFSASPPDPLFQGAYLMAEQAVIEAGAGAAAEIQTLIVQLLEPALPVTADGN